MARKKKSAESGFVLYDVVYQDGTRSSHRKVPCAKLAGVDEDLEARTCIEAQDRKVAGFSGKSRSPIKSVTRSHRRSGPQA
ncbi:MAG TPA: hypothetical protein VJ770_23195 [Stellaceae bacterium]|nr:hypothetical protein [Stellaceae bacterium]